MSRCRSCRCTQPSLRSHTHSRTRSSQLTSKTEGQDERSAPCRRSTSAHWPTQRRRTCGPHWPTVRARRGATLRSCWPAHGTLVNPSRPIDTGLAATEQLCSAMRERLTPHFGTVVNGWLNHTRGGTWTSPAIDEALRHVVEAGFRKVAVLSIRLPRRQRRERTGGPRRPAWAALVGGGPPAVPQRLPAAGLARGVPARGGARIPTIALRLTTLSLRRDDSGPPHSRTLLSRRALAMADTELKVMAALAIIGLSKQAQAATEPYLTACEDMFSCSSAAAAASRAASRDRRACPSQPAAEVDRRPPAYELPIRRKSAASVM